MSDPSGRTKQQRQASPSTSDEYLYLNYLNEYNRSLGPRAEAISEFLRKFNQFVMIILGAYVCNIDLMAGNKQSASFSSSWSIRGRRGRRRDALRALKITVPTYPNNDMSNQKRGWVYVKQLLKRLLPRPMPRSNWRQNLKMGWLVFAIQAVYATAVTVLLINLAYLYRYHISSKRLERVRYLIQVHGPSRLLALDDKILGDGFISLSRSHEVILSVADLEQILGTQANMSLQALTYLGDSFIQWGMINESGYWGIILLGLGFLGLFQVIYLYFNPAGTRLHRDLIDTKEEERRVNAFCETEVLKYLESSRVYATIIPSNNQLSLDDHLRQSPFARLYLHGDGSHRLTIASLVSEIKEKSRHQEESKTRNLREQQQQQQQQRGDPLNMRYRYALIDGDRISNHRASRLLMRLLVSGALRPLNSSKRWAGLINLGTTALIFMILISIIVLLCAVTYIFRLYEANSLDLDVKCVLIVVSFNTLAVTFHVVSLFVACLEQAILVNRCLSIINDCVRLNQQLFERLDLNRAALDIEKIGSNYLFALMTYKIFIAQFVSFRRTFRGIFLFGFAISFINPVLMHIHMPYLELEGEAATNMRLVNIAISLALLTLADTVSLPMCYLHSRCQRLYKALSSLLAHITEVRAHEKGKGIYNEHSVTLLLKELVFPEQMLDQLSDNAFGVSGTYSTLVELHFWWSIAELSILLGTSCDSYKQSNVFGSYLCDPLRVWRFRLI